MPHSRPSSNSFATHNDYPHPDPASTSSTSLNLPPSILLSTPMPSSPPRSMFTQKSQSLSKADKPVKHARRPSLSNFFRTSTSSNSVKSYHSQLSTPGSSRKDVLISGPQFQQYPMNRESTLGAGAQIVATPQEALQDIALEYPVEIPEESKEEEQIAYAEEQEPDRYSYQSSDQYNADEPLNDNSELASPPRSPRSPLPSTSTPLSPIQDDEEDEPEALQGTLHEAMQETLQQTFQSHSPPRPTRIVPPVPAVPLRPSLKQPHTAELLSAFPSVPPLPTNVHPSPPQPTFTPILLSPLPTSRSNVTVDPSKIIVSIETECQILKSTMRTLISRPSFLADYLTELIANDKSNHDDDDASSQYSQDAASETYHNFLADRGVIAPTSFSVHLFLDRPSAPYAHILTYLRSPPTPDHPETLPRGVQLQSNLSPHLSMMSNSGLNSSGSNLEGLLCLRDEALYLGLDGLYNLCTEELRVRPLVRKTQTHSRSSSNAAQILMTNNAHVRVGSSASLNTSSPLEDSQSDKSWGNNILKSNFLGPSITRGRHESSHTSPSSIMRDSTSTKSSTSTAESSSPTTPHSQLADLNNYSATFHHMEELGPVGRAGRSKSHSRVTAVIQNGDMASPRWI